jgi:Na+/proline symporter
MTLKHPEVARWDRSFQRYFAVAVVADAVLSVLFLGLSGRISPMDTIVLGLLFASSFALTFALVVNRLVRTRSFRDSWKKEHPPKV